MAYVKKNLTPQQRHERAVKAAAAIKNHRGGRPKGWTKDPAAKAVPPKTIALREPDYQVFSKLAFAANVPIVELMHNIAEAMKRRNPRVFDGTVSVKLED